MPVTAVIVTGILIQAAGVVLLFIEFLKPLASPPEERRRDPFLSIHAPTYDPFLRAPRKLWPGHSMERTIDGIVEWAETQTKREEEMTRWVADLARWVDEVDAWTHEASQRLLDMFAKATRRRWWGIVGSVVLAVGLGIEIAGNVFA